MNRFTAAVLSGFLLGSLIDAGSGSSQPFAVQARTNAIVTSFNKSKRAVREKYGVRVEKYKEVRSEPVIKENARDYSGFYEVPDMGFSLEVRVDANGNVTGNGSEPVDVDAGVMRRFSLRDARIQGALLTASKVYASGGTAPFEGAFISRTSFDSPTDRGVTTFGMGVIGAAVRFGGVTVDRLFYQRKQ